MTKQIPDNVLDVLKIARCVGDKLYLNGQLDPKLYRDTMKFIDLLGGRWDKKTKAHVFEGDCGERVEEAVMAGSVVNSRKLYQFFETPSNIADQMVSALDWLPGLLVLEPSAGNGRLIDAVSRLSIERHISPIQVEFCEVNEECAARVRKRLQWVTQAGTDFLKLGAQHIYDRIVMNPPFRGGQDVLHVRNAYEKHLNAGGQMVAIMSPSFEYRDTRLHAGFREFLESVRNDVDHLDAGAFSESGTEIRTVMVTLRKK